MRRIDDRQYQPFAVISISGYGGEKIRVANCIFNFLEGNEYHSNSYYSRNSPRKSPGRDRYPRAGPTDKYADNEIMRGRDRDY